MSRYRRNIAGSVVRKAILAVVFTVAFFGQTCCWAEGFASPICSTGLLKTIETYVGPIFPCGGIATTFRSEMGTTLLMGAVANAKLTGVFQQGANPITLDLGDSAFLDTTPFFVDFYTTLRLWRFGLRGSYAFAETPSKKLDFAKVDFSGFCLRGEVDVVQFCWLSLGLSCDVFFNDPSFHGSLALVAPKPGNEYLSDMGLNIIGDKPVAPGVYLRYVPPEIWNFPLHLEAWGRFPYKGAKLKSYGFAMVFRPQIYRFDVATRLIAENRHLKFGPEKNSQYEWASDPLVPAHQWEIDMEWKYFGAEVAVFF